MVIRHIVLIGFLLLLSAVAGAQMLVYQQDFKQVDPQWSEHHDMYMNERVENNKFVITQTKAKFSYQAVEVALEDGRDYSVETVVSHISGSDDGPFGLVFAGDGETNNYIFAISADGRYIFGGQNQSIFQPIIKWRASSAIKKGSGQPNKLRIETEGDNIKLMINGIMVNKIAMPQAFGNDIGFIVGKPQTAAFDYLTVSYLSGNGNEANDNQAKPAATLKVADNVKPIATPAAAAAVTSPPVVTTAKPAATASVSPPSNSGSIDTLQKDKISLKDAKEISYQAQETIEILQSLLNYVTFPDNTVSEQAQAITDSYSPSRSRVFFSKESIIENDIDPKFTLGNTVEVPAEKYLNELDLQYEKNLGRINSIFQIFTFPMLKRKITYM